MRPWLAWLLTAVAGAAAWLGLIALVRKWMGGRSPDADENAPDLREFHERLDRDAFDA